MFFWKRKALEIERRYETLFSLVDRYLRAVDPACVTNDRMHYPLELRLEGAIKKIEKDKRNADFENKVATIVNTHMRRYDEEFRDWVRQSIRETIMNQKITQQEIKKETK
jgi:hypothetical protein